MSFHSRPSRPPHRGARRSRVGRARPVIVTALAGAAVLLVLTGCEATVDHASDPPSAVARDPLPPDVTFGVPPQAEVSTDDCDALSGLRPTELPEPDRMPRGSTMERIAQRGRLVVGTDLGSNPLSFRDPITGDVKGFDIDVAHWISEAVFGDPNRIDYRMLSTDDRVDAIVRGDVDLVVKSMSITCSRYRRIDFSVPYYAASQRMLVYRNSGITKTSDLVGRSVCATRASTSIARVQRVVPSAQYVTTDSWADCLVMMQQGQVDVITSDDPILAGIAAQDPWVTMVGDSLGTENYAVGIAKGKEDFVRFVNAVLAEREADGSWQRSYNEWLSLLGPGSPPPTRYRD
ncbi:glutamate ABC transporter substrate-binding protein [Gordonia shandongensis]|uniref:glutamate ABC transporter substrate-binding protein n=1 Tax=Gordonia shandongensis TaxID=376351 RepID=UPI00068445D4|nr:glutamate ABC transporter substrate-binding protein [Gordonia shandongensis]